MLKTFSQLIIVYLVLALSLLHAEDKPSELRTDWLDSSVGSQGAVLGAEVLDIDQSSENNTTVLEIAFPIENIDNLENYEKIEIIEKKSQKPIPQIIEVERMTNYENGTYGLRLHIKKIPGLEFQLKLIDNDDEE